jgi:hypothetical protein
VDEPVAQSDDAVKFGNLRSQRRFYGACLVQGFADDLKLTLDCRA